MKTAKFGMVLALALSCESGGAEAATLLGLDLQQQTLFSQTYTTTGANAKINGSVLAGGAATIGAGSEVVGDLVAGGAASTGANSKVDGSLRAGGAASLGAASTVVGDLAAVGAISSGAGSAAGSEHALTVLSTGAAGVGAQVSAAQAALLAMGSGALLAPTITTDHTLFSGVYSAASLSTTAGTTLTLDGQGLNDQFWVFNIADILATGAGANIVLINAGQNASVIWNTGGYATLGADSTFLGTLLAHTYASVGANADLTGVNGNCGGVFSATSYISIGANATVGGSGCSGTDSGFGVDDHGTAFHSITTPPLNEVLAVPEPAAWCLLIIGFGFVGAALRHRRREARRLGAIAGAAENDA